MFGEFSLGDIVANVKANITDFQGKMALVRDESSSAGLSLGKMALVAGGVAAAFIAVKTAANFAEGSVKAFSESQDLIAQTNAVLKSTGEIAGVSADQVTKLSKALQSQTTYSDEDVRSVENLMLTFTSVGKDIFPQATGAVLDMATALKEDTKSAAIQLGKALQDPILGITALRRVGVNFNDSQKDVIKNLVETGQQAKAQQLILAEINKEFGGSAAAAATTYSGKIKQLKNSFNDFQELIGQAIVNKIYPLAIGFERWFQSMGGAEGLFEKFKKITQPVADVISAVGTALRLVFDTLTGGDPTIKASEERFNGIAKALGQVREAFEKYVLPALQTLINTFKKDLLPSLEKLYQQLQPLLVPLLKIWATVMLVEIVVTLRIMIDVLNIIIKTISFLINVVIDTAHAITVFGEAIGAFIYGAGHDLVNWFNNSVEFVTRIWRDLVHYIVNSPEEIGYAIGRIVRFYIELPGKVEQAVIQTYQAVIRWFKQTGAEAAQAATDLVNSVVNWFLQLPSRVSSAIQNFINTIRNGMNNARSNAADGAKGAVNDVAQWFTTLPSRIWDAIKGMGNQLYSWLKDIGGKAWDGFKKGMGIKSPSFIEKSMLQIVDTGKTSLKSLQGHMTQFNGFAAQLSTAGGLASATALSTSNSVQTNINGPISIGSQTDADYFFKRLTRGQELAKLGIPVPPGGVG